MPEHLMVLEDDLELRVMLEELLGEAGYEVAGFSSADTALRSLESGNEVDLVLSDLILPGLSGREFLGRVKVLRPELNVIIMTAFGSIESAIELIKGGAFDYLTKPLGSGDLLPAVQRGLEESRVRREVARLARSAVARPPAGFVGASRPMQEVYSLVARAAGSRHPVLLTGESGSGKELVARALHERSGRGPFVTVNCGALPEHLLESELFGHEKGAFTGADRSKEGLFEAAHLGTLFLDEISELALPLQPKLLRALEEAEIRRVGATRSRVVDVRLVAATNRDLEQEVKEGRFREDLFWRLNVLHIHLPPLRERPADIPFLAEFFLERALGDPTPDHATARSLTPEAMALLTAYPWPGNVRELRNAIQRAATLAVGPLVRSEDLPPRIRSVGQTASLVAGASTRRLPLRELERLYILEVVRQAGGNKSKAAEILGLDRKTLSRKLEEYRRDEAPEPPAP